MKKQQGFYEQYGKRIIDLFFSVAAMILLSPLFLMLTISGAIIMKGNPFFTQLRPGKGEKIFKLVKFRSMTCEKDASGKLLPDEKRITYYGKLLRSTSLDELPELWNIIKGDMSIVGPRPQLVQDMVFMTEEQRKRHTVRQGLTGLAQVSGRNQISWEKKFEYDLEYIEKITFWNDCSIILKTVGAVFKRQDVVREGTVSDQDFGDYLLEKGSVTKEEYDRKMEEAKQLTERYLNQNRR